MRAEVARVTPLINVGIPTYNRPEGGRAPNPGGDCQSKLRSQSAP